jgi:hypothetical protein
LAIFPFSEFTLIIFKQIISDRITFRYLNNENIGWISLEIAVMVVLVSVVIAAVVFVKGVVIFIVVIVEGVLLL